MNENQLIFAVVVAALVAVIVYNLFRVWTKRTQYQGGDFIVNIVFAILAGVAIWFAFQITGSYTQEPVMRLVEWVLGPL